MGANFRSPPQSHGVSGLLCSLMLHGVHIQRKVRSSLPHFHSLQDPRSSQTELSRVEYFRKTLEYDPIECDLLTADEAVIHMPDFRDACFQGQ